MSVKYWKAISVLLLAIDIIVGIISFFVAYKVRNIFFLDDYGVLQGLSVYLWILWVIILSWPIAFITFKVYEAKVYRSINGVMKIAARLILAVIVGVLAIAAAIYLSGRVEISRLFFLIFAVISFVFLYIEKLFVQVVLNRFFKQKSLHLKVLVVSDGISDNYQRFAENNPQYFIDVVDYITYKPDEADFAQELIKKIKEAIIDEVIFDLPTDTTLNMDEVLAECECMGIATTLVIQFYDFKIAKPEIDMIHDVPMVTFKTVNFTLWQSVLKRSLDVVGAIVGLLITAILFPFIALAIKLNSEGPIVFWQYRMGKNGRKFKFYKFRSMYKDAEERKKALMAQNEMDGYMFKMSDDPRITKVGRFLRKSSLDELPQMLCVLRGDMSLVGTRPPTLDEVNKYETRHLRRLSVKPGLTGMWQVSGRSEITSFDEVVALDVKYIDEWSIWLDLKILLKTVVVVFMRKGSK